MSEMRYAGCAMRDRLGKLLSAKIVSIVVLVLLSAPALAQTPRNLLAGRTSEAQLAAMLVPRERWHPYPTIDERERWNAVPAAIRQSFVQAAEREVGAEWGSIPATVTLRYVRDGDRAQYDAMNTRRRTRLATLVTAELLENKGRFVDEIANGIWAISEQTFWGSTAHLGVQKRGSGLPDVTEPVVELFSAETAALLAWTDYLMGDRLDKVSPLLRERIRVEVDRRILTPALERDDFAWMGFTDRKIVNNWNPWIASNWLASALILERDPQRRARTVHRIIRSLDVFMNGYPDDGGCDEGPSYWDRAAASLFDNLELLRSATNGGVDIYAHPLVRNMGQYIYRAYIKDQYFVNMGDAPAKVRPDPELVYAYGAHIGDPVMTGFGAFLARQRGPYGSGANTLGRILPALLGADEVAKATPREPLLADVWLPDLQLMAARAAAGSAAGWYLSAFGGHNAQSHNHNDVGNFVAYADGKPVLVDVGVETYTAKTFSPRRYEIWTMQSAYHNLPTINGVMQKDGAAFRARDVRREASTNSAKLTMDLAAAYPADAAVDRYERTVALDRRARTVSLDERYALREWRAPLRLNLMTPLRVDVSRPGELRLHGDGVGGFIIRYDAARFDVTSEEIPIADARLLPVWGNRLARVVLVSKDKSLRGEHHLSVEYAR
ncbi:MAG: heparinase [Gemmatimonadetes bacterium]|nr:MAG: heparinase [Gemmatimonadota bacterium]